MKLGLKVILGVGMILTYSSCKLLFPYSIGKDFKKIRFDTTEMTYPNVDISPDGNTILFDVLGDLYTVPLEGGTAKLLLGGDGSWNVNAKYSPDGKKIGFLSDRDGTIQLWTSNSNGTGAEKQGSSRIYGVWDAIRPLWTKEGYLLDYSHDKDLWFRLDNGKSMVLIPQITANYNGLVYQNGVMSAGGDYIYYSNDSNIFCLHLNTNRTYETLIDNKEGPDLKGIRKLQIGNKGGRIAFLSNLKVSDSTYEEYVSLHVLDLRTGRLKKVMDSIPSVSERDYAFTKDGDNLVLSYKGKLVKVHIATGEKTIIPVKVPVNKIIRRPLQPKTTRIADTGSIPPKIIRWPTYNRKNSQLAISALGKIYTNNTKTNETKRLTQGKLLEYSPAISPDGKWIAYVECDDFGYGEIIVVPSNGGIPKQITKSKGKYTNLTWSPNADKLAFLMDNSLIAMQGLDKKGIIREWSLSLMWMPVFQEYSPPKKVMDIRPINFDPGRFYPPIAFSKDGTKIYTSTRASYIKNNLVYGKEAVIFSVHLDGTDVKPLLYVPHVDELVISPDSKHVAMAKGDRILIADVPQDGKMRSWEELNPYVLTEMMGDFVYWSDTNTLLWANTNKIYIKSIDHPEQNATLLADIDIRAPIDVPEGTYALSNVRILTMRDDEVIENGTVLVENNRIVKVGGTKKITIPKGTTVYDLEGKTIIPGLIDTHAHSFYGGIELWQRQNRERINNLAWGVTTIYDPSIANLQVFGYSEMVKTGKTLGPRIYSSGSPIVGQPGSSRLRDIYSYKEAERLLKERTRYNPSLIKEYLQPHRKQRIWLRKAAKEYGLGITSHHGGSRSESDLYNALTRIIDGYTGLEHEILSGAVYNDVTSFVAKSKIYYTPTITSIHPAYKKGVDFVKNYSAYNEKILAFNPDILWASLMGSIQRLQGYGEEVGISSKVLAEIVRKGGKVSIGGHGLYIPGLCTHFELWTFDIGGISKYGILRAATINGAEKLGLDRDLGSIEPGKLADMVILNNNPLEDIHYTADIEYVISNGSIYEASTMTRIWPNYQELKSWPWKGRQEDNPQLWDF